MSIEDIQMSVQELEMEIEQVETWIFQLTQGLNISKETDPDYMTLLLQQAGAIQYLQELKAKLEELMKQMQQQQEQDESQENWGGGEPAPEPEEEPEEQEGHQAEFSYENHEKGEEVHEDVAPAPNGVCQALWDLVGEVNYKKLVQRIPVEMYTRVQQKAITGQNYRYDVPAPNGTVKHLSAPVIRVPGFKVAYIPEILTVVIDKAS